MKARSPPADQPSIAAKPLLRLQPSRASNKPAAVIIGRTGLHEWAYGFSSENPHFGPVRNPWNTQNSTGGSSGGSGAAVAAAITPISIGTDTGGSVRVPAAMCGTFGLKVTYNRIPLDGVFPLVPSLDTVGPLANSIDNLELAYRAMSADTEPEPELRPLRFGVPQPWYDLSPPTTKLRRPLRAPSTLSEIWDTKFTRYSCLKPIRPV